jgi:hypothetical protein
VTDPTQADDAPRTRSKAPKAAKAPKGGPDPIDELTANWEDPETKEVRTRELARQVLSKGVWATVVFLTQDLDRKTKAFRPPKISIRRYKKSGGNYRYQSGFNISSEKQAREIQSIIDTWFAPAGPGRQAVDACKAAGAVEEPEAGDG